MSKSREPLSSPVNASSGLRNNSSKRIEQVVYRDQLLMSGSIPDDQLCHPSRTVACKSSFLTGLHRGHGSDLKSERQNFFQSSKPAYNTPISIKSSLKVDQRSHQHTAKIMILRALLRRTPSCKINAMLNTSKQKKKNNKSP